MKITKYLLVAAFVIVVGVSCSRSGSPVVPSGSDVPDETAISGTSRAIDYSGVMGAWEVKVNTQTLAAEIIPARNAKAIGNIFDSDLSQFLMVSPCNNCLQIGAVRIGEEDDFILLDIYMKHPFKNIATRPDLHGFDVRAIFMSEASWVTAVPIDYMKLDGGEEDIVCDPWFLLNADGFTSHFDELVLDDRYFIHREDCPATINPYLRFFESYTTGTFDPQAPSGYNVMPVGSGNSMRTAVFYGGDGTDLMFYIVADVAYGQSAVLANRTSPQYYLPSFNRTEPWRTEYWIENNNLSVTDPNATADVVVQVFDWQHNATVDPAYPNPSNKAGVKESSKVTQVVLSMPQMMNDNVVATVPESGDGSPQNPLQYRLQIKNEKLTAWDTNWGMIAVRDELYGSVAPSGRLPVPASPAGFPYETQDIRDYSYYGAVWVNNPDSEYGDQVYDNEIELDEESTFSNGQTSITADFFMDPSHRKFQYRWDYDYDGVTFDEDGGGMPSPRFPVPVGKTNVGLRIRTNSVPPREYIYTIPTYRPGEEYDKSLSDQGYQNDITSSRGSNSIATLGEKVVVAFSSIKTGNREIYVSVYDNAAQQTISSRLTTTIGSCYDPVMTIIEEGAHAGIYVVFVCRNGDEKRIMSSFGNPYSGGFPSGNIKTIATVSTLFTNVNQPCLVTNGTELVAYYHRYSALPSSSDTIRVSKSTDYAQTWSSPQVVDSSSVDQLNPSAIHYPRDHRYYVVWDDGRDEGTRGRDLYMTYSVDSDGLTYGTPENLSTSVGVTHEEEPSIASFNRHIGIAYLQYAQGQTNKALYLMDMTSSGLFKNVVKIDAPAAPITTVSPSLGMGSESVFTICYGYYNYNTDANEVGLVVVSPNYSLPYYAYSYPSEDLGITSTSPLSPYPAVVSKESASGYAVESFIAHRSFRDGADDDAVPFPEKFGYVDVKSIIIQGY